MFTGNRFYASLGGTDFSLFIKIDDLVQKDACYPGFGL